MKLLFNAGKALAAVLLLVLNADVVWSLSGFNAYVIALLPEQARIPTVGLVLVADAALLLYSLWSLWSKNYRSFLVASCLVVVLLLAHTVGSQKLQDLSRQRAQATVAAFLDDPQRFKHTYDDATIAPQLGRDGSPKPTVELVFSSPMFGRYDFRVSQPGAQPFIVALFDTDVPSFILYR
jgi:hypothetical protein